MNTHFVRAHCIRSSAILTMLVLMTTLVAAQRNPTAVSKEVEGRTGHAVNTAVKAATFSVPPGVSLDDGVTEDEAVALALWNNAALQSEFATLGLARADVIEAGLLRNPSLTLIFPFSFRILEAVANWPFEALWQRPRRVKAAKLEQDRVGETLISRSLDLVRDVRLICVEYEAARTRQAIAESLVRERGEIAIIVKARLRAGDISELETSASVVATKQAEEQAALFSRDAELAQERLRSLIGFDHTSPPLRLLAPAPHLVPEVNQIVSAQILSAAVPSATTVSAPLLNEPAQTLDELVKQALEARPELKAAELAIQAAGARAKWERSRILQVTAIAKEYGRGNSGFEQGPGLMIDLPIFNRNQGQISRADAEVERAAKLLVAAHQRVVADVREAYTQLLQAREGHTIWRTRVLPPLEQDIGLAQTAYRSGDVPFLFVLETARRYSDERLREADFQAASGRALAHLERSVGRRLIAKP